MADNCNTIAQRLAEARQAYHDIMIGGAISRFVDQNGEQIQYTRANSSLLAAYITRLEAEEARCTGAATAYRGPLRFTFGRRC